MSHVKKRQYACAFVLIEANADLNNKMINMKKPIELVPCPPDNAVRDELIAAGEV